jgi:hypothetical protein
MTFINTIRMPTQSKKSEGKGKGKVAKVKAAVSGATDDFDDMLAELRAADVTAEVAASSSRIASSTYSSSSISSTSTPSTNSTNQPSTATAEEVSEAALTQACVRGDILQLRRWARCGVRVICAEPLCYAAGLNKYEMALILVRELGAEVNKADKQDFTPLYIAAQQGNLRMAQCLVNELGADVNRGDAEGRTPLSIAARSGHMAMVRCLVKKLGADINQADNVLCSPLFFAAEEGKLKMVQYLVKELNADVNLASKVGSTPLMVAAENMHHEVVRYLLKHGADPLASHNCLGTAADISKCKGAPDEQTAYLLARTHCANPGCTNAGLKKCERCLEAYFCGSACIRMHWPAHKAECTAATAKLKAARSTPSSSSSSMPS